MVDDTDTQCVLDLTTGKMAWEEIPSRPSTVKKPRKARGFWARAKKRMPALRKALKPFAEA